MSILLVAHLRSLVRVAEHPERLRGEVVDRSSDIISRQLPQTRGSPQVVEGENLVALPKHLVELTEVEVGGQAGAVPQDMQVDVPAPVSFRKQASGPVRSLCYPTLRDRVDPHSPQPDQQTLRSALSLGQLKNGCRVHSHLWRRPAAPSKLCRV